MNRIILNDNIFTEEYVSWRELKKLLARDQVMHGIVTTVVFEIRLIQSAYDLINNLDASDDVAAVCTCVIQSHTSVGGWKDEFNGLLDFTTLDKNNKEATKTIIISAYSEEFGNKLIERMDTEIPYDRLIGLDDNVIIPNANEYQDVTIDGIQVVNISTGTGPDTPNAISTNNLFTPTILFDSLFDIRTVYFKIWASDTDALINDCFYYTKVFANVILDFDMHWSISNTTLSGFIYIDRYINDPITNTVTFVNREYTSPEFAGVDLNQNTIVNLSLTLNAFECLIVSYRTFNQALEAHEFILYEDSSLKVTSSSKADPTPCNFVPPYELGARILEQITGQSTPLTSPMFGRTDLGYAEDGKGSLLFATNGKLVRQFPTGYTTAGEAKVGQLGSSFKSWFDNYDKVYSLGAGVIFEDGQYKLYVDDRANFYLNSVVYSIGSFSESEAKSFGKEKLLELYYSEVEVGSVYEAPEEVSGLEEYLARQKYSTPILNENKLDLVSDFITTAYPFEFARRKPFTGTETEDYKYDNNVMLFKVYRDGGFVQHSAQEFDEILGLENITSYINLDITPQRILKYNHGWWINTGLRGYQDKYLKYNKSDIVTDLSTLKVGEVAPAVENSDIQITSLATAKFTGNVVRFSAPVSAATFDLIRNSPYELIKYPDPLTGGDGYGFVKEVSNSPIDKKTNFELWETTGFQEGESYRLLENSSYRLLETGGIRLLEQ